MIIDLFKLKRSVSGEEQFSFDYTTETELINLPMVEIVFPIKVEGVATLTGNHSALVDFDIEFTLKGQCTRCLAETEQTYSLTVCEECDAESVYPVVNDRINLDKIVEDQILMNIPVNFLCSEDCKGICVGCGANLNAEQCKCKNG